MTIEFFWWSFLGVLIAGHLMSRFLPFGVKSGDISKKAANRIAIRAFVVWIPTTVLLCLFLAFNVPW